MQQKFLLIVHQKTSDPGRMGHRLQQRGFGLDICCPMHDDPLPSTMDDHVGAVIFGGPMSANDDHLAGVRAELDWLPTMIDSGKPFLGICLGAQMLARVLGGKVDFHREGKAEIGYYPIRPTPAAKGFLDREICVYHWHREGFEVPPDGVLLAEGESFAHQAFRYGDKAFGVQYHPEVTREMMQRWLVNGAHRLSLPGARRPEEHLAGHDRHDADLGDWLDRFMDMWLPQPQPVLMAAD